MWISGPAKRVSAAGRVGSLRPGFQLQRGMRVGLLGGSFNPAHEGHAHVAETALTRLRLDKVIWLVSPQNPLKPAAETRASGAARGQKRISNGRRSAAMRRPQLSARRRAIAIATSLMGAYRATAAITPTAVLR